MTSLGPEHIQAFVNQLQRQQAVYAEIAKLTKAQIENIHKGNHDEVLSLQGPKQKLMKELDEIENRIRPIKENWDKIHSAVSAGLVEPGDAALREVRDGLKALIDLENELSALVSSEKSTTKDRLNQINRSRQANQAYGLPNPADPRFLDKKE